mmetsp:Transcript_11646/g.20395  ORF Transcript_11646/g.20395 Transcript_11646/m.20395 type:complete len:254 (-) Transcript_11646:188-949(-)
MRIGLPSCPSSSTITTILSASCNRFTPCPSSPNPLPASAAATPPAGARAASSRAASSTSAPPAGASIAGAGTAPSRLIAFSAALSTAPTPTPAPAAGGSPSTTPVPPGGLVAIPPCMPRPAAATAARPSWRPWTERGWAPPTIGDPGMLVLTCRFISIPTPPGPMPKPGDVVPGMHSRICEPGAEPTMCGVANHMAAADAAYGDGAKPLPMYILAHCSCCCCCSRSAMVKRHCAISLSCCMRTATGESRSAWL